MRLDYAWRYENDIRGVSLVVSYVWLGPYMLIKMQTVFSWFVILLGAAEAQQLYITTTGFPDRPQCTQPASSPEYHFQPFSYTLNETVR
jgi:hypothetical protein